jgi:hypothetical protein
MPAKRALTWHHVPQTRSVLKIFRKAMAYQRPRATCLDLARTVGCGIAAAFAASVAIRQVEGAHGLD